MELEALLVAAQDIMEERENHDVSQINRFHQGGTGITSAVEESTRLRRAKFNSEQVIISAGNFNVRDAGICLIGNDFCEDCPPSLAKEHGFL